VDKDVLSIFQMETEKQCTFALMAHKDMQTALQAADTNRIWYSVQAFLIAAGNLSKLLWNPHASIPDRPEELRNSFGVSDSSPLAPRQFRNHFEHFDERLETWATSSKRKNFVDSNVGPSGMFPGFAPEDYLRNFDTTKGAVTFRGDEYILKPVADAIVELHAKAQTAANKLPWE
jgi:hypothetical protein